MQLSRCNIDGLQPYTVKNINGKYLKIVRHFFSRTNISHPKTEILNSPAIFLTDAVFYLSKTKNLELPEKTTYVRKVIILLDAIPDAELSTLQCELHTSGLDILPYTHLTASDKSFFALAGIELLTERLSISASGHLDHYTTDACNKVIKFQL